MGSAGGSRLELESSSASLSFRVFRKPAAWRRRPGYCSLTAIVWNDSQFAAALRRAAMVRNCSTLRAWSGTRTRSQDGTCVFSLRWVTVTLYLCESKSYCLFNDLAYQYSIIAWPHRQARALFARVFGSIHLPPPLLTLPRFFIV